MIQLEASLKAGNTIEGMEFAEKLLRKKFSKIDGEYPNEIIRISYNLEDDKCKDVKVNASDSVLYRLNVMDNEDARS